MKVSGNQTAAHLIVYKALSSPFLQPPLYHSDIVLLVIPVCYATSLGGAWLVTLGCVLLGCLCVTATIVLLALSHCRLSTSIMTYARWVGFSAMVLFCLAAVVFPMGFYVEEIGGEPYQLPNSFQVCGLMSLSFAYIVSCNYCVCVCFTV
ncbi:uncharacterized protein E2C01_067113 [Portunus trituberculatus]|uniref:Uncharacterized protein n=1 Tax=Portunus trituberculatus TaxID=210409 RepID=A0A5B7HK48_PORTR|nr:uncharacterized protein [Portunus trituberculatus]